MQGGTPIPENANLDDYATPGNYHCHLSATARTLKNSPFTSAFILKVEYGNGVGYVSQTAIRHDTGQKAWRYNSMSAWTGWIYFSDDATVLKQIAKAINVSGIPDKYGEIQVDFDYTKMIPLVFVCSDRTGWLYTYRQVSNNVIAIHIEGNENQPNGTYNGKLYYYEL